MPRLGQKVPKRKLCNMSGEGDKGPKKKKKFNCQDVSQGKDEEIVGGRIDTC